MDTKVSKELSNIELDKWPGMVVVGEQVSEAQAGIILLQTDYHILPHSQHGEDETWFKAMYAAAGYGWVYRDYNYDSENACSEDMRKRISSLDIQYLHNDRINSSWIGGLHDT